MAFCTNCGTEIEDDVAFCPSCGTKMEGGLFKGLGRKLSGESFFQSMPVENMAKAILPFFPKTKGRLI